MAFALTHLLGFNAKRPSGGGSPPPTIRNHGFGADQGNAASSSSTYGDQASVTISSPVANKNHLIIANGLMSWVTSATQIAGVRLRNDTDSATFNEVIAGAFATAAKLGFAAFGVWNSGGSPSSHTFSIEYCRSSGSNSISLEDSGIFWLEMDDDDHFSETAAENSYTGAQAWVDCHTANWTVPATGNWLILACADMRAATGNAHGVRLYDGTNVYGEVSRECKNNTDYYSWFHAEVMSLSAGSMTWKIQQRPNGFAFGNVRLRNMKFCAINLDKFAAYWVSQAQSESQNTTTTPSSKISHTFTVNAATARDHFSLQNVAIGKTSGSNRAQVEHREDSSQVVGMYDYADANSTSMGSNPVAKVRCPSLDNSGSHTYDTRFQISATTTTAKAKSAISLVVDLQNA